MPAHRIERINEEIKRELAEILRSLKDPRIPVIISIVGVETTPDLRYCKVWVSFIDNEAAAEAVEGLNSAAGFIRREIGQRVQLRYTPQFIFISDTSIAYGAKINKMLKEITSKQEEDNHGKDS